MKIDGITGVLLAGGKSRRMGTDKRHIMLNGQTLFERSLATLEGLFSEVLVVLAEDDYELAIRNNKIVLDLIPNCATAGGLFTGLSYAQHNMVFVVACDMPFLHNSLITYMASCAVGFDITVGKLLHGVQPLHGFYRKSCLATLEEMIRGNDLKLQHLLKKPGLAVNVLPEAELRAMDRQLLSFMNLNTPGDLEMATKLLRS